MTPQEALKQGAGKLGLDLPQASSERLMQYIALLAKWNRTYNLTGDRIRLGRGSDNDVVLSDVSVSRYHAEIRREPGGWVIQDDTPRPRRAAAPARS
jgi:hypothetical protein